VNKRVSKRTQTQLAFGAAVILLVVSAVAAYATVARLRIAERWVGHTRDVQSSLADLNNISAGPGVRAPSTSIPATAPCSRTINRRPPTFRRKCS
jgi:hypothetical protein